MLEKPIWSPSSQRVAESNLTKFVNSLDGASFETYQDLWQWSNDNREKFWNALWKFADIKGSQGNSFFNGDNNIINARFFPNGELNYAENLLRYRNDESAIVFRDETGKEREVSWNQLYNSVSQLRQALASMGIKKGDRVAGYMPNMPETIVAALATASLGAIWSSASPDFGVQGLIDRFAQIEPTVLMCTDGYYYNGKPHDCLEKTKQALEKLLSVKHTLVVPFVSDEQKVEKLRGGKNYQQVLTQYSVGEILFEPVPFNHPLFIMFSSGTTGVPKCIVHGHGGTLLQHVKEHLLHCDIKPKDRLFYFTTCGWMMWNWLVSGLACGATLLLYDGSPFYPDGNVLWDFISKHRCKFFGTSAKYIDALKNANLKPNDNFNLDHLETLASTGSPLVHEGFDYVYENIKSDLHLASIYGGTDIISASFGIGNPWSPVWRGEIQGAGLATPVEIFNDEGQPIPAGGGAGELVCTGPIPSMPVGFWNDENNKRYSAAYFEHFPNVWHHGDWVEKTSHHGLIVYGRSDATLNPGGVRIGTAEIYRQVELIDEVAESLAVGQDISGDQRIVLFVRLNEGAKCDEALTAKIKQQIRSGASPRHVPAVIVAVADIPRTKSGKIVELAVRNIIHNRPVKNVEALANPEALSLYQDLPELKLES